jgi:glycine cleavage system aminomethyltransferase T
MLYRGLWKEYGAVTRFELEGSEAVEEVIFKRSKTFGPVAEECQAVRNAVGLIETSSFAKYEVMGADAESAHGQLLANKMPREGGPEPHAELRGQAELTSGGYAHHAETSVALGYVPAEVLDQAADDGFSIEILGERRPARLQPDPLFDPTASRMRG